MVLLGNEIEALEEAKEKCFEEIDNYLKKSANGIDYKEEIEELEKEVSDIDEAITILSAYFG